MRRRVIPLAVLPLAAVPLSAIAPLAAAAPAPPAATAPAPATLTGVATRTATNEVQVRLVTSAAWAFVQYRVGTATSWTQRSVTTPTGSGTALLPATTTAIRVRPAYVLTWTSVPVPPASPTASAYETEVVRLVNQARASGRQCGTTWMPPVAAVAVDSRLVAAARAHSADMAARGYFSHTTPDGRTPGDRITAAGYRWRSYGENIAMGYRDPAAAVSGWLGSVGHCTNLMNAGFTQTGVGVTGTYWTQVFAAPR